LKSFPAIPAPRIELLDLKRQSHRFSTLLFQHNDTPLPSSDSHSHSHSPHPGHVSEQRCPLMGRCRARSCLVSAESGGSRRSGEHERGQTTSNARVTASQPCCSNTMTLHSRRRTRTRTRTRAERGPASSRLSREVRGEVGSTSGASLGGRRGCGAPLRLEPPDSAETRQDRALHRPMSGHRCSDQCPALVGERKSCC
jgi:hypothetical protein